MNESYKKPRVCAVSYLNTVPLVWGMLHGEQAEAFDLSFAIPAECAARLEDGRADIGIVPVAELLRQNLNIVPGCGIACQGAVRSILLVSRVPFAQIRTLAVDSSSRTSVMLSRVVLARKYGVEPELVRRAPNLEAMLAECDAALVIGDPALRIDPATLPFACLDLGAEWLELTGLPMVFAVWAARPDAPAVDARLFTDSLRFGQQHVDQIAAEYHERVGISEELAREYLTRYIVYPIGERENAGLQRFLQAARELQQREEMRKVPA